MNHWTLKVFDPKEVSQLSSYMLIIWKLAIPLERIPFLSIKNNYLKIN